MRTVEHCQRRRVAPTCSRYVPVSTSFHVNYPDLPRLGLPGPRLLRSGLPVSVSELASDVDTAVPDSAGDFPLQAVWSVLLLPIGHSATTAGARFLSGLNAGGDVVSIVLLSSTAGVVNVAESLFANRAGTVSPPYSAPSGRSVAEGGLAPSPQKLKIRYYP